MIKKALIIAAGNGSRLRQESTDLPKPLHKVAGLRLIERIITTSKQAGISEFVIVVGYQKEKIIKTLNPEKLGVKITFVENNDWQLPNGHSVLAAKDVINENFVLLMSDHIFDKSNLETLKKAHLGAERVILGTDKKINEVFDIDDATKVLVDEKTGKIISIGKELSDYNRIDTGMFLCTPDLFEALEQAKSQKGTCSLSDGIQILASKNQMGTWDVGSGWWFDVDTPESQAFADKFLFQKCRKDTDGFISRNFNRYVSLFLSRQFLKLNVSANHVTCFTSLVGIMSGIIVAQGTYWAGFWGAFLFKMASILDGCDGEISKLKLTSSKFGQWFDTISDNLTYIVFIVGLVIGLSNRGTPHIFITGTLTLFGLGMTLLVMFVYLLRNTDSGSLLALQKDFQQSADENKIKKLLSKVQFMLKRDFFALFFFVLAIFDQLEVVLILTLIGTNVAWIVILSKSFGLYKDSQQVSESVDVTSS